MSEYTAKPGDDDFEDQVSALMHAGPERTITMADGHVGQEVIARKRQRDAAKGKLGAIMRGLGGSDAAADFADTMGKLQEMPGPELGLVTDTAVHEIPGARRHVVLRNLQAESELYDGMQTVEGFGQKVKEFNLLAGHAVRTTPQIISYAEASDVMNWAFFGEDNVTSEVEELVCAFADNDLPQIADALGDIVYLMYTLAIRSGIDLDAVLAEIHRSNMTKFEDGKPVFYPGTNKVGKGKFYEEPDITGVLNLTKDETGEWRYAG